MGGRSQGEMLSFDTGIEHSVSAPRANRAAEAPRSREELPSLHRVATSKPPGKRTTEQELAGSKFRVRYDNGAAAWHAAGDNWQPIAQVTTGVHSSGRRSPPSHLQPSQPIAQQSERSEGYATSSSSSIVSESSPGLPTQPIAQQSERSELRPHWCNQSHSKASAKPAA